MPVSVSPHIDYQSPTGFSTPLDYQPAIITTHEEPTEIGLHARPSTWARNTARVQHMRSEKVAGVGKKSSNNAKENLILGYHFEL